MLGIGFSEMVLIAGIALIVIGPEKFPDFAKLVIRTIRDLRGYVDEVKREVGKELRPLKDEVNSLSKIDPEKYIDSLTKDVPDKKPANPGLHEEDRKVMEGGADYANDPYGWEGSSPGGYDTDAGEAPASTVSYGASTEETGEPEAEAERGAAPQEDTPEVAESSAESDSTFEGLDSVAKDSESDVWTGRQSD